MLPQTELELEYQDENTQKKQFGASDGLVLVTSLVDKIPNLGGKSMRWENRMHVICVTLLNSEIHSILF